MCARVAYAALAGLFVFVAATVAAFAYLPWWQALFASAGTFGALVLLARYYVLRTVRRVRDLVGTVLDAGGTLATAFDARGRALRGASVDVHAVRRAGDTDAVTFEFTVFPAGPDANEPWDPADLRLTPAEAAPGKPLGPVAIVPRDVFTVEAGEATPAAGPVRGPRRVRLTADAPRAAFPLALRCGGAQFGRIDLPRGVSA